MPPVKPLDRNEEEFLMLYITGGSRADAMRACHMNGWQVTHLLERKAFRDAYERMTGSALGYIEVSARKIAGELESLAFDDSYQTKNGDKLKALEMLGKMAGIDMFREVVKTEGKDEVARKKTLEIEERLKLMEKNRASIMGEDENRS